MPILRRCGLAIALLLLSVRVLADAPAWLPVRDQNPFVLGTGLPLPPQTLAHGGDWTIDAYIAEANTQLIGKTSSSAIVFGAETRESRLALAYAVTDDWTLRASVGDVWIGVGFLDRPIRHFHDLIGASQGDRGHLGVAPPFIGVIRDGHVLYTLDRPSQDVAPLLVDATHSWSLSERENFGIALGGKIPFGSTRGLNDTGSTGLYAFAFADLMIFDATQIGARVGYLHESGNEVLPTLARHHVPFGDVYARTPLFGDWSAELQYDIHGPLYRDLPNFLSYAGILSAGVTHPLGTHAKLILALSEDVPIGHTQDVALEAAVEMRFGRN